jgi:hypothetical protein
MRRNVTILLGAEGCSEAANAPWLREATKAEIEVFNADLKESMGGGNLGPITVDGTGRPYWHMTVLGEVAPEAVWIRANLGWRHLRLED